LVTILDLNKVPQYYKVLEIYFHISRENEINKEINHKGTLPATAMTPFETVSLIKVIPTEYLNIRVKSYKTCNSLSNQIPIQISIFQY